MWLSIRSGAAYRIAVGESFIHGVSDNSGPPSGSSLRPGIDWLSSDPLANLRRIKELLRDAAPQ
jgi:hypothetical protein